MTILDLFISSSPPLTIAAIYVDDIILTGSDFCTIDTLKTHLHKVFSIKDLGKLNYFLGIELTHINEGIILTQKKFTKELLQACSLDVSKAAKTPLPIKLKLLADEGEFTDPAQYRCLVGKLNFLTHTRPDLSFALVYVLRYIAHTPSQGILLHATDSLILQGYSDSDWGSCPNTRSL